MKRCQFVLANRAENIVKSSLLVAFYCTSVCMLVARKHSAIISVNFMFSVQVRKKGVK